MKIATITPTRGDRAELFNFCTQQLSRQTLQPNNVITVPFSPSDDQPDLVKRVKHGYQLAKEKGIDYIVFIEDDDFYPDTYLANIDYNYDFFGYSDTIYYNLRNRTYAKFEHPNRSSLFCTGCKVSALESFNWPADNSVFLDLKLWHYAVQRRKRIKLLPNNPCLGIKHNVGLCGGKAHKWKMVNEDPNLKYLESRVDGRAFGFYTDLMKRL